MAGAVFRTTVPADGLAHEFTVGQIVHVASRHEDCVEVWFLSDSTGAGTPVTRTLRVVGTGHEIDLAAHKHIGSAVTPSGWLVWHLFERMEAAQ